MHHMVWSCSYTGSRMPADIAALHQTVCCRYTLVGSVGNTDQLCPVCIRMVYCSPKQTVLAGLLVMLALTAASGQLTASIDPRTTIMGTGDCSEPSYLKLDPKNPKEAPTIITGKVVAYGPGHARCVPANTTNQQLQQLFPDGAATDRLAGNSSAESTELVADLRDVNATKSVIVLEVTCVHKGALSCRSHSADAPNKRCVVAVEVEAPAEPNKTCTPSVGGRYMFLLGSKSASECDGLYSLAYPSLLDSARPPLSFNSCVPYPSFPEPSTSLEAKSWPAQLSGFCPGSKDRPAACAADPCTSSAARNCSEGAAIACLAKTCPGTIMVGGFMYPEATCTPVYMDKATGLPVGSCKATDRALQRQQNRIARATPAGQAAVANRQQQAAQARSGVRPRLANVEQALNTPVTSNRQRLADALAQQAQQP